MIGTAIVIPCYNLGRTVGEALASVWGQTRPAAEVIVVDDGSDDVHTRQTLARLEDRGTRVLRTPNCGVAAARNYGIAATSAPYIVLLDADDVLEAAYLERLGHVLDSRPDVDFVSCGLRAFGAASYEWWPPACTWVQTLARGGPHISTMFRRRVWSESNGFDQGLEGYEDLDFWLSALERGCRGEVLPDVLLRYRVRQRSRYQQAIVPERYRRTMAAIHSKHPPRSPADRLALLVEKDAFLEEQRGHRDALQQRTVERNMALDGTRGQLGEARDRCVHASLEPLRWGDLRRTSPTSPVWGLDRGKPLDRYYIEGFLERHRQDIRGRVLEIKDPGYAKWFGAAEAVSEIQVLDLAASNPQVTLVADLARPESVPEHAFDCFILTQTLHIIYDTRAVLASAYRLLKPGGVLLCTVPSISRVSYEDGGLDNGDFWRYTAAALRRLFAEVFPIDAFEVTSHGNVMACAAFLHGVALEELSREQLDHNDPFFPLICCVRAVKPVETGLAPRRPRTPVRHDRGGGRRAGAVLLYHRVSSLTPDTHRLCLAPEDFRVQMQHLREHYSPMPLDALVEQVAVDTLPEGAVAVTFDDGYLDNLELASPVLMEFGIPATFFVNTAGLNEPYESWWDVLDGIFSPESLIPVAIDVHDYGLGSRPTRTSQERAETHRALFETMYPMSGEQRDAMLARVVAWSGLALPVRASHRVMTADEICELAVRPGHSIGAHTVRHLSLPSQPEGVQLREQLECKMQLQRLLRRRVSALAYPYGEFNRITVDAARTAGFDIAVTVEGRLVCTGVEPLLIPRVEVPAGGLEMFSPFMKRAFSETTRGQ